jgi:hypothetical protein
MASNRRRGLCTSPDTSILVSSISPLKYSMRHMSKHREERQLNRDGSKLVALTVISFFPTTSLMETDLLKEEE